MRNLSDSQPDFVNRALAATGIALFPEVKD